MSTRTGISSTYKHENADSDFVHTHVKYMYSLTAPLTRTEFSSSGVFIAATKLPTSNIGVVAGFLSGQIQQSTPSATAANSLNVSQLRVNVDVDAAFLPTLTLSGLTGSQSADTDTLGVGTDATSASVFKTTAVWRRNAGDAPREREIGHAYTRTLYAHARTHARTHARARTHTH